MSEFIALLNASINAWGIVIGAIVSILSIILGWILNEFSQARERERQKNIQDTRVRRHWKALIAAVYQFQNYAATYVHSKIAAPLYRLPTNDFSQAFRTILSEDASLHPAQLMTLLGLQSKAEEMNRGLDRAANAAAQESKNVQDEYRRLVKKACDLLSQIRTAAGVLHNRFPEGLRHKTTAEIQCEQLFRRSEIEDSSIDGSEDTTGNKSTPDE